MAETDRLPEARQAGDEVEVTPEMIEAGDDVIGQHYCAFLTGDREEQKVAIKEAYLRMAKLAQKS
jgi:hypothetical protein